MTAPDRRTFLMGSAGTMAAFGLQPEWLSPPRLSAPLSVAVIGAGRQGRALLAELQKFEDVTVAALCDVDESRLSSGARRAAGAEGYADHRELLDKAQGVQAVLVATPTHTHEEVAVDCLAAGKHVYCEGPLAHTIESAQRIAKAARGAKGVFQTGMHARSNPVYTLAWTFVRSGAMRDVIQARAQSHKKTSWRTPARDPEREKALNWRLDPEVSIGLPGELGTHQFDAVHWYLDAYPKSVRGRGAIRLHHDGREIADTVSCQLLFDGGLELLWDASLCSSYERTYELYRGSMSTFKMAWTHGWMFKEADAPTQGWEVYANRQRFHDDEGITLIADATKLAAQGKLKEGVGLPNPPDYYAVEAFVKSASEGQPSVCSADEGLRAAVVGILANRAVLTGEEIAIDEAFFQVD